jgi:hypothetical protein
MFHSFIFFLAGKAISVYSGVQKMSENGKDSLTREDGRLLENS